MNSLSSIQIKELIKKFKKLNSIEEQLNFWTTNLPINFIQYTLEYNDPNHQLSIFTPEINSGNKELYLLWVQKNYKHLMSGNRLVRTVLDLEKMKAEIEILYNKSDNKIELIQKEIRNVESSFKTIQGISSKVGLKLNSTYSADYKSYYDFLSYQLEPEFLKVQIPSPNEIITALNGVVLAKYMMYLREMLNKTINDQSKKTKELSLDQKLLALNYFGILSKVMEANENNIARGKFLSQLLRNDFESIRQRFSSINDLLDPKEKAKKKKLSDDLTQLQQFFQEFGLDPIVKKIKSDLRKLNTVKDSMNL